MSLFGSSATSKPSAFTFPPAATTSSTATPSLFGSSTTPSKPLFGSTTTSSTPSLFGSTGTTTTSAPAGTLFGGSSTPGASSLFGKSSTTTTSTLLGTSLPATSTTGSSLFGNTTYMSNRMLRRQDAVGQIDLNVLRQVQQEQQPSTSAANNNNEVQRTPRTPSSSRNLFGQGGLDSRRNASLSISLPPLVKDEEPAGIPVHDQRRATRNRDETAPEDGPTTSKRLFRPGNLSIGVNSSVQPSILEQNRPPPAPGVGVQKTFFGGPVSPKKELTITTGLAPPTLARPSFLASPLKPTMTSFQPTQQVQNTSRPFGATFGSTNTGGSLFNKSSTGTTGGGLFGSTGLQTQQAQQQQQVSQQQQVIQAYHPFVKACGNPQLTGTENDKHFANLNQVAAALGVGKAPYRDGNQVQTFGMEGNVFEKFVGIGYNKISERTDDEGIVSLVLRHTVQELNTDERKAKILEAITNILGNQQNLKVIYAPGAQLRPLPDGSTEICIIVKEGGFVVPACKFAQVLNDGSRAQQLETQLRVDKTKILAKVGMSKAQRERYLETVPDGIDERIWRQAIAENPAPSKMLPVAVRGWEALRDRQRAQIGETKLYRDAMGTLVGRIEKVQTDHARAQVEMEAIRCRHKQLSYRLLRILLAQWISQRFSRQIDTDEDQIEARADTLLAKFNRKNQLQAWIENFYETLETNGGKLLEGAEKAYDMTEPDQKYARTFLTEILYIGERLVETSQLQREDLEMIRRTLDGE